MRLVYYSLSNSPGDSREWQFIQSIRSLRRHNPAIPVWLFLFNGATAELREETRRCRVEVCYLGNYREYLQRAHARGSVLALYPTFHKFLSLIHGPVESASQILYLDCDTFFHGNVERLFDQYPAHEWYAREEPMSLRSHHGCNSEHIDEALLEHMARIRGARSVVPFNSGVCLLNHGVWNRLEDVRVQYLDLAWRLLCGRMLRPPEGIVENEQIRHAVLSSLDDIDRRRALPYPSNNTWIIEQIALWQALGNLPHFSQGLLSRAHVNQGNEFSPHLSPDCIVVHYFSLNEAEFFRELGEIG
jgi:hypothetical protein